MGIDFENLISEFVATKTVRYEKFATVWKDMNFGLIYCGLATTQEKEEFMEEAFQLAVMYLSPPFDFQQRTGGLYLLYALYFTQGHLPQIKVRMTLEQWRHLMDLYKCLKKQGHLDACYVLMRLRAQKAFCFTHRTKQFALHKPVTEDNRDKWLAENQREIELAFPEDLLRKMHSTHIKYQVLKETLGLAGEGKLGFVKKSMAEIIANRVQNISDESEDEMSRTRQAENRGDRIAQIKNKSFSFGVQPEKEPQSSTTAEITSGEEDGSSPSSKGRPWRRGPGRKPKPTVPAAEEKSLVEKLMPKLKKYTLSDSEEEKDDPPVKTSKMENPPKPTDQTTATKQPPDKSKDKDDSPIKSKAQNQRKLQKQKTGGKKPQVQAKEKEDLPVTSKVQDQRKASKQKRVEKRPQDQPKGKEMPSRTYHSQEKKRPSSQKVTGKKPQDKKKGSKRPAARPNLVSLPLKKRKKDWS